MKIKQVLVMRKLFPGPDGKPRKIRTGKYIAQAAHASLGVILDFFMTDGKLDPKGMDDWFTQKFTKVCLGVDTEEELLSVFEKAVAAGLPVKLITDAGDTEFGGKPTKTCLAIGPAPSEKIDQITGALSLM